MGYPAFFNGLKEIWVGIPEDKWSAKAMWEEENLEVICVIGQHLNKIRLFLIFE
jgi:hypothetical protein